MDFGHDSADRPAYFFRFLIEHGRDRQKVGTARIRLGQRLRDEVIARDDQRYPFVQVVNRADWEQLDGG